jgi:hypothetical protein
MSDPLYPYSHGALPGGDGAPPPPRYSDLEVDLIAARYTGTPPPPYPSSSTDVSAFDSHVGAFDSGVGAFDSHVGAFGSGVGAFDSHVGAFDSGVGPFDSRIGAFDSRVGAFDPRFGARRSAEGESCHLPCFGWCKAFPSVLTGQCWLYGRGVGDLFPGRGYRGVRTYDCFVNL